MTEAGTGTGKLQVLIVENRREWRGIIEQVTAETTGIQIQAVQTYGEALTALEKQAFSLAVIDLTLRIPEHDYDNDGTHDGLQVLADLAQRSPQTKLVIIGESLSRETLLNTPGIPETLTLLNRANWDQASLRDVLKQVLNGGVDSVMVTGLSAAIATRSVVEADPKRATAPHAGLTGPLRSGLTPPGVGSRPGRARILIVEDDAGWQEQLAQLMEHDQYFWRVAPTQEQAMERLKLETFHLILLDLMLGDDHVPLREGKGWQLLDYVINNSPKTKVLVISEIASSADVARLFMGYPIKGYMDKRAFNEGELRTLVREQSAGPSLRIVTLGDFRVLRDGKLINDFGHDLAEKMVKILLSRRGESISVDELVEYVWPGADPREHYATLGTIINAVRNALEPDLPRPSDSKFIIRSGLNYQFNMINVEVDAEQLRQYVSEGRQHERNGETEQALKNYKIARELYRGDYLPMERLARWTMQERSALQTLYTEALNRMADLHAEQGDLKTAIEVASQAQQVDSYVESTYRRLMRYHACLGNKNAALSVYRRLVKLFSEFFGEDPSPQTTELYQDIEADRPIDCVEDKTATSEHPVTD
ncbi:MAG: BTAD domain-containing putative transcriptional regulator [Anaerolineae bacterium]